MKPWLASRNHGAPSPFSLASQLLQIAVPRPWVVTGALLALLTGCASSHIIDPRGYDQTGTASYYGSRHHGKRTASGEAFDQHALTAAHRELPFGTRVQVTNLGNAKSVVVRINDRGPHTRGRLIDLSRGAAQQLDMLRSGTAKVRIQALSD
ncbi:septal ring lytic transglycosylase RlpA family protein [Pseudomonas sp. NFXW11]